MNLAADKWIPVVCLDGQHDEVSLATAFTEGHRIADLAVRPPERIALMRLLLCVAHAALDPTGKDPRPRDQDDWHDCRDELATKAGAYMQRWASAFELLDGDARFLQVQKLVLAVARQGGKNRKSDSGGGEQTKENSWINSTFSWLREQTLHSSTTPVARNVLSPSHVWQ